MPKESLVTCIVYCIQCSLDSSISQVVAYEKDNQAPIIKNVCDLSVTDLFSEPGGGQHERHFVELPATTIHVDSNYIKYYRSFEQ